MGFVLETLGGGRGRCLLSRLAATTALTHTKVGAHGRRRFCVKWSVVNLVRETTGFVIASHMVLGR